MPDARVVGDQARLRLHRIAGDALRMKRQAHDLRCPGEGFIDRRAAAVLVVDRQVARHFGMELRRRLLRARPRHRPAPAGRDSRRRSARRRPAPPPRSPPRSAPPAPRRSAPAPCASALRCGTLMTVPSLPLKCSDRPRALEAGLHQCSPQNTPSTPGLADAGLMSIAAISACARSARRKMAAGLSGQVPIGGISPLSGQKTMVLAPALEWHRSCQLPIDIGQPCSRRHVRRRIESESDRIEPGRLVK